MKRAAAHFAALFCVAIASAGLAARQAAPLKIVVIEGEGAVNIIQQKTAVAPVIEVRDRNDQPVAGATVNFVIRAGRATFSGARTLTVTTNAAGRAAAAGLAPSGTGALQIGATATFQGQAATAVTIAQTNVLTAAEAAAASTAGAGGSSGAATAAGGASSGGGVSGTTLGVIGAAAAGGVLVASQQSSDEPAPVPAAATFSGTVTGTLEVRFFPVNASSSCTNLDTQTIVISIRLDPGDGPVSGSMNINGDESRVPGTCPPTEDNNYILRGKWALNGPLSGTRDSMLATVRMSNSFSTPRNSGEVVDEFSFSGRLAGDVITGDLKFTTRNSYVAANGVPGVGVGAATYNVTLNRK